METVKAIVGTILSPIVEANKMINTYSTSFKKEKEIEYFKSIQSTLVVDKQQNNDALIERAQTISELWKLD